jgi:DNA-binding SARP family transcriptional activator/WD40 repeat protein
MGGVQVLGPTRIEGSDDALTRRDAVVLSALCVMPGEAMSIDVLADALWGEQLPKSWSKVVQGAVVRLRKLLGAHAIETTQTGYRVRLLDGELDTHEFERLAARGRSFAAVREPHRAATTFEQALALWRGPAFAELPDWDPARAEAARLVEVRRAIEEERVIAMLAAGRASEAAAEAGSLVTGEPYRENRWCLLAEALYRTGRQREALAVLRRARLTLREELGLDPGPELATLERRILQQDPSLLEVPIRAPGHSGVCPYQGLRPFDAEDADFFHGRDAVIDEAIRRLEAFPLLVVVGPSGSGKSSLVRAGLLPELARRGRSAVVLNPGTDPPASLATALASTSDPSAVVVDQLEEAFTESADAERAAHFCDRLAELAGGETPVVVTLRADFLGALAASAALSRLAERGLLLLTPLSESDLREAIEAPARQVGLVLEPGLVDLLVRDVLGEPGGLPLLSHALAETWEHRDGVVLTVEGYAATGGIRGAVAKSAERLYDSLSAEDRVALRSVLHRLVTPTPAGEPTVARVPTRVFAGSPDAPRLLDLLVRSRLVTTTEDTASIAHESLVRAWPRMRTWLDEDVEGQRILAHLQVAADGWMTLGRPADELYRGARLAAAQEWVERTSPVLAPIEAEFLAAAADREDDERSHEQRRSVAQARRNRQLRGALAAAAVLLVVSLVAGSLAAINGREASRAATAADAGRLGALAASGVPYDKALLYAAQAVATDDSPASESDVFATLLRGDAVTAALRAPGTVAGLAFTERGDEVWATTVDGHVLAWPASGGNATTDTDLQRHLAGPALLPGGRVVVGTPEGVSVVEPHTGAVIEHGPPTDPFLWALSPDGSTAVSNGLSSGGVRTSALDVWLLGTTEVTSVRLSAPPARIVGCGTETACALTEDNHLVRVRYADGTVGSDVRLAADTRPELAASSDGSRVAIARSDGLVEILDPSTGAVERTLPGGSRNPVALAFSPDGRRLAGADFDTVLVWPLDGDGLPQRYEGHAGEVGMAAWSPDGSTLATGATDKTVMLWDTVGRERVGRIVSNGLGGDTSTLWPTAHGVVVGQFGGRLLLVDTTSGEITELRRAAKWDRDISTARSSPDGDLLITADTDGVTTVWDLRTGRARGTVDVPAADMRRYTGDTWVSPDGTTAATLRDDTGVFLIDMERNRLVRQLPPFPDAAMVDWAAVQGWTSDGSALVVSRDLGPTEGGAEIVLVDATTGDVRLRVPLTGGIAYEVAADPKGRFLAAAMSDGTLRVIDSGDGHALAPPLQATEGEAFNVSVSPDGSYIAVSGWPPRLTVWDTRTFRQVGIPLPLDLDAREARARFTPDGDLVVTSGEVMREFDIDPAQWLARACREAGRTLSPAEFEEVLPGKPYRPAC